MLPWRRSTALPYHVRPPHLGDAIRERITRASCIPAFATYAAFTVLGASQITLLTPYNDAVNAREIIFLAGFGMEVIADGNLALETYGEMACLSPEELLAWAEMATAAASAAIFMSCTALRSAGLTAAL